MKIGLYYEYGEKKEIGMGHKYRAAQVSKELEKRGHTVEHFHDQTFLNKEWGVLIIDHVFEKAKMITNAKKKKVAVVLIDGAEEDADKVDVSISSFYNSKSKYRGIKYMAFSPPKYWKRYNPDTNSRVAFVALGGFDINNYINLVLDVLNKLNIHSIVAPSINHNNLKQRFNKIELLGRDDDYYDAMKDCLFAITNGGLTLFQALCFGMPSIAVAQYNHQKNNIAGVKTCCMESNPDEKDLEDKINTIFNDEYIRRDLSNISRNMVDGEGVNRICDLVEGLG